MYKKRLWAYILVALLCFSTLSWANPQYTTKTDLDLSLMSASAVMAGTGLLLGSSLKPLTREQVNSLVMKDVLFCDRWTCVRLSQNSKTLSDVMLSISTLAPLLVLASPYLNKNQRQSYAVMYAETMAVNFSLSWLTKHLVKRIRPYVYNPAVPMEEKIRSNDARKSFYSGHTSASFASMVFLARTHAALFPNSGLKPVIWIVGLSAAAIVSTNRMLSGRHFLTDVLVGALVGSVIGYIIPEIHKKDSVNRSISDSSFSVSFQFSF
ncbi:phosphatase PAP2 family protein [Acidobacteriota bacterium]